MSEQELWPCKSHIAYDLMHLHKILHQNIKITHLDFRQANQSLFSAIDVDLIPIISILINKLHLACCLFESLQYFPNGKLFWWNLRKLKVAGGIYHSYHTIVKTCNNSISFKNSIQTSWPSHICSLAILLKFVLIKPNNILLYFH